jgi:hypothetical protein
MDMNVIAYAALVVLGIVYVVRRKSRLKSEQE